MIQWTCRQCGEPLEAPESLAHEDLACARCGLEQPVGGVVEALAAAARAASAPARSTDDGVIDAARRRLELERIAARPTLRAALRQTAWGLGIYIVMSIGVAVVEIGSMLQGVDLGIMAPLVWLGWLIGAVWLLCGVIRALLAGARMI